MVEICIICKGKGKVPQDSEFLPGVVVPSTTNPSQSLIQCYGCLGFGWVNPDNPRSRPSYPDPFPIFPSYPTYPPYSPYPYYPPNIWCNVSRSI